MAGKSGIGESTRSCADVFDNNSGNDCKLDATGSNLDLTCLGTPSGLGTMRALEPRILLDAAAMVTAVDTIADQISQDAQVWKLENIEGGVEEKPACDIPLPLAQNADITEKSNQKDSEETNTDLLVSLLEIDSENAGAVYKTSPINDAQIWLNPKPSFESDTPEIYPHMMDDDLWDLGSPLEAGKPEPAVSQSEILAPNIDGAQIWINNDADETLSILTQSDDDTSIPVDEIDLPEQLVKIVFIDFTVDGYQAIVDTLDPGTEIHFINSQSDGVEQIAGILNERQNVGAIHIITHGRSGTLDLGNAKLTEASIAGKHADEMAFIRDALSENGDILIYGCNFGQYARGISAVSALASATGADVAASDDLTGAANLGGDWDLEVEVGEIQSVAIEAVDFASLLAESFNITSFNGTSASGTVGTGAETGTFTLTRTAASGLNGTVNFSDGANGIGVKNNDSGSTGTAGNPNSFTYNFDVTPDAGASVDSITLTRQQYSPGGNAEPSTFTITWAGGGTATLTDPQGRFTSHANGATFASGTVLTFGNLNGGSVTNNSSLWNIDIPASSLTVTVTAIVNATGNADYAHEWLAFNSTLTAAPTNTAPVAASDGPFSVQPSVINNVDPAANDTDADGDTLTITEIIDPANPGSPLAISVGNPVILTSGTVIDLLANGTVDVTPPADMAQAETFDYTISDGNGGTSTATVTLNRDTDGDGIGDTDDIDDDNDGILDVNEGALNFVEIDDLYNLVGSATRISATEVQLTPDTNNQAGTIMSFNPISIADDFTFTYEIFLGDETSPLGGADGITFIMHNDPAGSNAVGLAGGGIGATGIVDGIFVEFDTFNNTAFGAFNSDDVAGDHTQIRDTDNGFNDAAGAITAVTDLGQLEDLAWHQVSVSWDASTSTLSYLIDGVAMASYTDTNIANTRFGGSDQVYFGFSASTGGATNDQRVRDIAFTGTFGDTDIDNVEDARDRDSDNDGISDLIESGASAAIIAADTNNDGSISLTEAAAANGGVADADGDGLMDIFDADTADTSAAASIGTVAVNTDGTGPADFIDLDSDDDGIPDAVEAQPTAGYTTPAGPVDANGVNPTGLFVPVNTDGLNDGADYIDTDADEDGALDSAESGLTPGIDANGDGIGDGINASYADPDGDVNDPVNDLTNVIGSPAEADYREDNTPPVAQDDAIATTEDAFVSGNVFDDNGSGVDNDADGDTLTISQVNGVAANVGVQITLASGSLLTVNADGSFDYDPNGSFENLNVGDTGTDTFTYLVSDGNGGTDTATVTVTITGANDAPTLDNDGDDSAGVVAGGYDTTFTENGAAVGIVDSDVDIADIDSDQITEATITLTNGQIGDVLNIGALPAGLAAISAPNPPGPLVAAGPITVTIIGAGTTADYEAALLAITFQSNSENPSTSNRILNIQVAENADLSNTATTTIHVAAVNDPPVIDLDADNSSGINSGNFQSSYTENDPALAISDADVVIQDLDDTNIESATITLTNGQIGDLLSIGALPPGISLVGVPPSPLTAPGSVTIQLTGSAAIASYQTALQAIGFSSISEDPDITQRAITIVVNDGDDNSNAATNFIDVSKANDAPNAVDDTGATDEDSILSVGAVAGLIDSNDTDFDAADTLTVTEINGATINVGNQIMLSSGALLTVNADGSYEYDPNGAFENLNVGDTDTDSFTYLVSDGNGGTDTATVTITINGVNDTPVADDESVITDEDVPVTIDVLDGDTDVDGTIDPTSVGIEDPANPGTFVTSLTEAGVGTWTADTDPLSPTHGQITFTPALHYNGPVTPITYQVADNDGATTTAIVDVALDGVNDAPLANPESFIIDEDVGLAANVLSNDSDVDGHPLTVVGATVDINGDGMQNNLALGAAQALTNTAGDSIGDITLLAGGTVIFNPTADYNGPVPQVTYTIDDGNGGTATTTLDITITPINDPPVLDLDADDSSLVVGDGFQNTFTEDGGPVAAIDTDVSITDPDDTSMSQAIIGVGGLADGADEILTIGGTSFALNTAHLGTVTVGGTTFAIAYSSVTGNIGISNAAGGDMLIADLEALLASITYENTSQNPTAGDRTLGVSVNDGDVTSNIAVSTITVVPVNDAPVAVDDTNSTDEDTAISINATNGLIDLNDTDPENDTLNVTQVNSVPANVGTQITLASGALLTVNPDGSYDYDPNGAFESLAVGSTGTDSFTHEISDGNGGIDTATVTLTITGVNDAPDAVDDTGTTDEDSVLSTTAATGLINPNDTDPDASDVLTVSQVNGNPANVGTQITLASGALLTVNADGSYDYDTNGAFENLAVGETGADSFTYSVSDGNGGTDTATVTLTINGVNDTPDAVDDTGTTDEDTAISIGAAAGLIDTNDMDPDASDTLTVSEVNGVPGDVGNQITLPSGALLTVNADGSYDYDPNGAFESLAVGESGADSFSYIVSDGNGGTDTATVTLTINGVNDTPDAVDDTATTDEDTAISIAAGSGLIDPNDTDPDATDVLNVSAVNGAPGDVSTQITLASGALLTVNADGSYDYDPNGAFESLAVGATGTDSFTYTVSDGNGGTDTATVTLTINGVNDVPIIVDPLNPGTPPADPDNVIPDVTTTDGATPATINADDYIDDPDGDTLTFSESGLPPGLSINSSTGEITGTLDNSASQGGPGSDGIYNVVITGADLHGAAVTTTITYTITNPDPNAVSDTSISDEDTQQTGNVITDATTGDSDTLPDSDAVLVTDVDGTPVSTGSPAVINLTHGELTMNEDGSWTFDPNSVANQLTAGDTVQEIVTYTITDDDGATDTATLTLDITGINDPVQVADPTDPSTDPTDPSYDPTNPTVIADPDNLIPDESYDDGALITTIPAGNYFGDAEGDTLTYSVADLPPGLSINSTTGEITGTIDNSASQGGNGGSGIYDVTITATDPQNNTATTTVTFTVNNPAPIAVDDTSMGDEDIQQTGNVITDATTGDSDTPPDSDPIVVSSVAASRNDIPATGDPATVGTPVSGLNGGEFSIASDGTYVFDPGLDFQDLDVGETRQTSIEYQISDGQGGFDTATLLVTVTGSNDAPVITDPNKPSGIPNSPSQPLDPDNIIPDVAGKDNTPISPLDVSSYFVDVDGEKITFSIDPNGPSSPSWISINPDTGIITGTPPANASQGGPGSDGLYQIVIIGKDPDGASVQTTIDFQIENIAPVIIAQLPDLSDRVGAGVSYSTRDAFLDIDGDDLTFTAIGLPTGLSIDPDTGEITGNLAPTAYIDAPGPNGTYTVTVSVDDGERGTVSTSFVYSITPLQYVNSNTPEPSLNLIEPGNNSSGQSQQSLILSAALDAISPLGTPAGIFDFDHPITDAINQIDPLNAFSQLSDALHPLTELMRWIDETRGLLENGLSDHLALGDVYNAFLGGDAYSISGEISIVARSLVINEFVLLEISGDNYDAREWDIGLGGGRELPAWIDNRDNRAFIILRPADFESIKLILNGPNSKLELNLDMVTGQIGLEDHPDRVTASPLFSSQINEINSAEIKQIMLLLGSV